jgi:aquaporin Z
MRTPRALFIAEFVGTALLVGVGVSLVILDFGSGSPVVAALPSEGIRRLLTGFLFGATGALIAISPVGKVSGAHINPVVTLAFWWKGKMSPGHALGYVASQLAGAVAGALPLLAWGAMGASIEFGATLPDPGYGPGVALIGETVTTLALIVSLFCFLGHQKLRRFTPLLFPFLYAVMVFIEAPISGTSTNPARTLGPAVISGAWQGWWVYWLGPLLGSLLGVGIHALAWFRRFEVLVAKVYHFDHDPHDVFRRQTYPPRSSGAGTAGR